jgi:hypothetical protein
MIYVLKILHPKTRNIPLPSSNQTDKPVIEKMNSIHIIYGEDVIVNENLAYLIYPHAINITNLKDSVLISKYLFSFAFTGTN